MNKKAVGPEFLLMLTLATVGFIILLGLIGGAATKLPDELSQQVCHASVMARANAAISIKDPTDFTGVDLKLKTVPLLCKTIDVKISGTKKEVMQKFADLMALCWWTFGEGEKPFTIEAFLASDTCFPCFIVSIKNIKDENQVIGIEEFDNWLRTNNLTKKNVSYYTYLTNFRGIPGVVDISNTIEPKQSYYIMYSDAKQGIVHGHDVPNGLYVDNINKLPNRQGTAVLGVPIPGTRASCTMLQGVEGQ